ncbi:hypothetical protein GLA29479_411 [Lysobacter antibioticus]|nr:hypothetical protein GLA29479_411 [Lysobacter antibioticus]
MNEQHYEQIPDIDLRRMNADTSPATTAGSWPRCRMSHGSDSR